MPLHNLMQKKLIPCSVKTTGCAAVIYSLRTGVKVSTLLPFHSSYWLTLEAWKMYFLTCFIHNIRISYSINKASRACPGMTNFALQN